MLTYMLVLGVKAVDLGYSISNNVPISLTSKELGLQIR